MSRFWKRAAVSAVATALLAGSEVVLSDLDGKPVRALSDGPAKTAVFVFTRSDCPISNRYAPELNRLYEKFHKRGVDFWLVYVDPNESTEAIRKHLEAYGYRLGALLDPRHQLVARAQATITPEAAVYVGSRMVYHGRIDNRYVNVGILRRAVTEHDLEWVVQAITDGRGVTPAATRAVGCVIEDLK